MTRTSRNLLCSMALCFALGSTGCGTSDTNKPLDLDIEGSSLTGDIVIDGSSTVYPISEAVSAGFKKEHESVTPTVGKSGTGGGFKRFVKDETDVSDASRPIKLEELQACDDAGVSFIELPVAYDGITFVINKENDWCSELTVEQLQKIFLAEGKTKTWKDVDPSWPEEEIKLFAPGLDSGTYDYFKEVVGGKEEKEIRGDMSVSEEDNVLVKGVIGSKFALGFFGCAYYYANQNQLGAVKIVNKGGTAVGPTKEAIEDGSYNPFSRPLFIYVKTKSLANPQVKRFVEFYLENAPEQAAKVGYVALPTEVYDRAKKHLSEKITGTHFLSEEGEKRSGTVTELYTEDAIYSAK